MTDPLDRLDHLAPEAPAEPALGALVTDVRRARRQRLGLAALMAVLAVAAAAAVVVIDGEERDGAVDPVDDLPVELVPTVFDGAPRLDPLRDLPDCDRHEELQAWATSVLADDFAAYPQAGPMPSGPMLPADLDVVASMAPVLLATDDGSPSACLTALAGPDDLVAWEQRDADGHLVARAAAAPWASNLMPDLGGPTDEVRALMDSATSPYGDDELVGLRNGVDSFRAPLAGPGLTNGRAFPVLVDDVLGVSVGTANWDIRLQIETFALDVLPLDPLSSVRVPNALSELAAAEPNLVGVLASQRLVWSEVNRWSSEAAGVELPVGWAWCGRPSVAPPDRSLELDTGALYCGPDSTRIVLYTGEPVSGDVDHETETGARIRVGEVVDGRRRASATYLVAEAGELVDQSQVVEAPAEVGSEVLVAVLERLPQVRSLPPTELAIAPGPRAAPTLREARTRLLETGSPLAHVTFNGVRGEKLDLLDEPLDHRGLEVNHPDLPPGTLGVSIWEPPGERWLEPVDAGIRFWSIAGRTFVSPTPSDGVVRSARTRCGTWELTVGSEQPDRFQPLELLGDLADAFGCGHLD